MENLRKYVSQEAQSYVAPPAKEVAATLQLGDRAPSSAKLPFPTGKPTIVVFLRHCGCPFAEKTFRSLAELSTKHKGIRCIAVSHSSEDATERWVEQVGGEWEVSVLVDEARDLYAAWGLGLGSYWSVWNPRIIASAVRLSQTDHIANRTTESGSRWQTGGAFAVDALGVVRWTQVASSVDEVPDLRMALVALRVPGAGR
ncbi:hypothetical protein RB595_009167 [Gaeumannomyces hyphopodioides]